MTDNMQSNNNSSNSSSGIGARLKSAREAMHMSEKDAANRLHLNPKFINIMETEDFENGPPVTFMRGYLRSYAKMLNLSESEINQAIEQLGMKTPSSHVATPLLNTPLSNNNDRYVRWITYLIILLLVMLVGIWWSARENSEVSNKNAVKTPTPTITQHPQTPPSPQVPAVNPPATIAPPAATSQPPSGALPSAQPVQIPTTTTPPVSNTSIPATQQPTPGISSATAPTPTSNEPETPKSDLSHLKMAAPESGLDNGIDGGGDEEYDH